MRLSFRGKRVVNCLRIAWVLAIVWNELGVFYHAANSCDWPQLDYADTHTHVLVVADPQILDHRSYPDRSALLTWLSRVFTDLNLRKSWSAVSKKNPQAVVFLGDMMDNGRNAMEDAEYEDYYHRFKSIFHLDSNIPVYYIPGNHDTGLGSSSTFSQNASDRYISHFGPLNSVIDIADHRFVLIDAPSLAEEDNQRHQRGISYGEWSPVPGGPVEFVKKLTIEPPQKQPTILLTHIPLARPHGASCGPLRERGSIHRGIGFGYQNTLGTQASEFMLNALRPSLVFSGDDHDYCEYLHENNINGRPVQIKEVSVKSFSMAMGVRHPGYQLLSLASPAHTPPGAPTFAEKPCLLPNQLGIYLDVYVPLIVTSIIALVLAKFLRGRSQNASTSAYLPLDDIGPSSSSATSFTTHLRSRANSTLPLPGSSSASRPRNRHRNSFFKDLRDVAVYPIIVFVLITWWSFVDQSDGSGTSDR